MLISLRKELNPSVSFGNDIDGLVERNYWTTSVQPTIIQAKLNVAYWLATATEAELTIILLVLLQGRGGGVVVRQTYGLVLQNRFKWICHIDQGMLCHRWSVCWSSDVICDWREKKVKSFPCTHSNTQNINHIPLMRCCTQNKTRVYQPLLYSWQISWLVSNMRSTTLLRVFIRHIHDIKSNKSWNRVILVLLQLNKTHLYSALSNLNKHSLVQYISWIHDAINPACWGL